MRIVLDAMGSDDCPEPEIQATIEAASLYPQDIIFLVGPEDQLKSRINAPSGRENIQVVHAPETITMEDKGLQLALKAKRKGSQTSMAVGIDLVQSGQADVFVTAGNTGGALATSYYRLGVIPGLDRPALTGLIPVKNGFCTVLDIGANPDCKPENLVQFAVLGSVFNEKIRGIKNPKVALLSNGEEAGKGNELVKGAYKLLESSGLNFVGNLEGKELFAGAADVVVVDGFTGNILLKSSEAVSKFLIDTIRHEIKSNLITTLGGLLAKPAFDKVRQTLNPDEIGAAILLGVNGLVYIGHGRSNAHALVSAIRTARQAVEANLLAALYTAIQEKLTILPSLETA
jgi:glycerol-3-phosphate acyltransferase PlsX